MQISIIHFLPYLLYPTYVLVNTHNLTQELYPQHQESSADDSSGDEEYPGGELDDQWRLGETAPDDEFAHLSDLWEDTTPHTEGKGRKYTFSKQR